MERLIVKMEVMKKDVRLSLPGTHQWNARYKCHFFAAIMKNTPHCDPDLSCKP